LGIQAVFIVNYLFLLKSI